MRLSAFLLLNLAVLAGACGTGSEDTGTDDQHVEIWPEAAENLGAIRVVLPEASDKPVDAFTITFDQDLTGAPPAAPAHLFVRPGVVQRARRGPGRLVLRSGPREDAIALTITAQQTTTIDLRLLSLGYGPGGSGTSPRASFGPTPRWNLPGIRLVANELSTNLAGFIERDDMGGLNGKATSYAPLLPADYEIRLDGIATGVEPERPVAAASVQTLQVERGSLALLKPSRVRFSMPERRLPNAEPAPIDACSGLPNAMSRLLMVGVTPSWSDPDDHAPDEDPASLCWKGTRWWLGGNYENTISRVMKLATTATLDLYPPSFASASALDPRYVLQLNPYFSVDVPLGPPGGPTTEVRVERLDVHDITVTREDGTTYLERGNWRLRMWTDDGWSIWLNEVGQPHEKVFRTNTGLDVPPGKYQVQTECVAADCDERFQSYDIDVR